MQLSTTLSKRSTAIGTPHWTNPNPNPNPKPKPNPKPNPNPNHNPNPDPDPNPNPNPYPHPTPTPPPPLPLTPPLTLRVAWYWVLATCSSPLAHCRQLRITPAAAAPLLLLDDDEARPEAGVGSGAEAGAEAEAEAEAEVEAEVEAAAEAAAAAAGNGERDGWWTTLARRCRGAIRFARELDRHAHTSHALLLGGETTPARQRTLPLSTPWPVPQAIREGGRGKQRA